MALARYPGRTELLAYAEHLAHLRRPLPSTDQRKAGVLPPAPQDKCKPTAIRDAFRVGGGHGRLRQLLQQSALPQDFGRRRAIGCPQGPTG